MRRTGLVGVLAIALMVGACTSEEDFTVPATGVHEAYVARVVDALAEAHVETLRVVEDEREVTTEVQARLAATFAPEEARRRADGLRNVLAQDLEGFPGSRGAPSRRVHGLLDANGDCVLAEVEVAFPVVEDPVAGEDAAPGQEPPVGPGGQGAGRPVVVELRRAAVDEAVNPTGWVIAREELVTGPAPERGCG